ncbi:hypothetical protein [Streptomyces sp. NPDC048349]|uniref:hypothetical protein n=1 Tax=Streptomyces sp. NPDC048349 TaxID=3155486 RepID=UPI00341D6101
MFVAPDLVQELLPLLEGEVGGGVPGGFIPHPFAGQCHAFGERADQGLFLVVAGGDHGGPVESMAFRGQCFEQACQFGAQGAGEAGVDEDQHVLGMAVQDRGDDLARGERRGEQTLGVGLGKREEVPGRDAAQAVPGDVDDDRFPVLRRGEVLLAQELTELVHRTHGGRPAHVEAAVLAEARVGQPVRDPLHLRGDGLVEAGRAVFVAVHCDHDQPPPDDPVQLFPTHRYPPAPCAMCGARLVQPIRGGRWTVDGGSAVAGHGYDRQRTVPVDCRTVGCTVERCTGNGGT